MYDLVLLNKLKKILLTSQKYYNVYQNVRSYVLWYVNQGDYKVV